jgi:hypothetical protein
MKGFVLGTASAIIAIFLMANLILASYILTITVAETSGNSYGSLALKVAMNNSDMAAAHYITSTGLDTRVRSGSTDLPHMLADNKTLFATALTSHETKNLNFVTGQTPLPSFHIVTGYNGYITTADDDVLELGDNFSIELSGWVNASAGTDKYLVYKPNAFATFISAANTVSSVIIGQTYPMVETSSGGNNNSDNTSHTVNLPASIEARDLLLVFFVADGNPTITFPAGWTQLFQDANGTAVVLGAWYRIADGTEGATITVTTSASEKSAHASYRISGYYGVPEVETSVFNTGTIPNPPSLTPSWGSAHCLWFGVEGNDSNETVSDYPSGYTLTSNNYANSGDGCSLGVAGENVTAASEDPGMFTITGSQEYVTNTIAIRGGLWVTGSIDTGEHKIETYTQPLNPPFGPDLTFEIDDAVEDVVSMSGISVLDSTDNWTWLQNNVMSYADNITISIGGGEVLRYEPVAIISGATLPDRTGTAQDGTIYWGDNPAGVTVTTGEFSNSDPAKLSAFPTTTDNTTIISGPLTAPPTMYTELDTSKIPGGSIIDEILGVSETPKALWWFPFVFIGISIVALLIFEATQKTGGEGSLLTMCIVIEAMLVFGGILGVANVTSLLPLWCAFLFPIPASALILSRRHVGWG